MSKKKKLEILLGFLFVVFFLSYLAIFIYLRVFKGNYCESHSRGLTPAVDCFCKKDIACIFWYSKYQFLSKIGLIVGVPFILIGITYGIIQKIKKSREK
jgi:hypothetical protein